MKAIANKVIIQIPRRALLAMPVLASTDESRYVLKGINIEVYPREKKEKVIICATNGRYLGVLRQGQIDQWPNDRPRRKLSFTVEVPTKMIASLDRRSKHLPDDIHLLFSEADNSVTFFTGKTSVETEIIDGCFPSWRQVIPLTEFAPLEPNFDWDYLQDFAKVGRMLSGKKSTRIQMKVRGHKPRECDKYPGSVPYSIFLSNLPEFYGVLMPLVGKGEERVPEWINEETDASEAPVVPPMPAEVKTEAKVEDRPEVPIP